MRLQGNRLTSEPLTQDPNTGNRISDNVFIGFTVDDHAYVLESYDEATPEDGVRHQRISVHYLLLYEETVLMIADVSVDGELIVFAKTVLRRV